MTDAICPKCKYYRLRPEPILFTEADLQCPKILEAKINGEDKENARIDLEGWRYANQYAKREPFDYEPHQYPWCAACTPYDRNLFEAIDRVVESGGDQLQLQQMARISVEQSEKLIQKVVDGDLTALEELAAKGSAKFNPVTGEVMKLYTLCAYVNKTGQCPLFELKTS